MNKEYNVIAAFTRLQYTLTVSVTAGTGTVRRIPAWDFYPCGEVVILSAQPDGPYSFKSWGGDAKGTEPEIKVTVDKNMNVTASFQRIGY
jgi:hypothetical protein